VGLQRRQEIGMLLLLPLLLPLPLPSVTTPPPIDSTSFLGLGLCIACWSQREQAWSSRLEEEALSIWNTHTPRKKTSCVYRCEQVSFKSHKQNFKN